MKDEFLSFENLKSYMSHLQQYTNIIANLFQLNFIKIEAYTTPKNAWVAFNVVAASLAARQNSNNIIERLAVLANMALIIWNIFLGTF